MPRDAEPKKPQRPHQAEVDRPLDGCREWRETGRVEVNPDYRQWVGWGDRTVDEMAHLWVDVTYLEPEEMRGGRRAEGEGGGMRQ